MRLDGAAEAALAELRAATARVLVDENHQPLVGGYGGSVRGVRSEA